MARIREKGRSLELRLAHGFLLSNDSFSIYCSTTRFLVRQLRILRGVGRPSSPGQNRRLATVRSTLRGGF